MSFDPYVAICHPLHYTTVMNNRFCLQLVLACWAVSFVLMFSPTIMISQLPFCGSNIMNHFSCDTSLLLQLSCTDTEFIEGLMLIILIIIIPDILIVIADPYCCIIVTILHVPSSMGRKKAFSTCSAHLMVAMIFYSTCIYSYVCPAQRGGQDDKVHSFFSVVTQMLNPYIYSLRNNQVKHALKESILKAFSSSLRQLQRNGLRIAVGGKTDWINILPIKIVLRCEKQRQMLKQHVYFYLSHDQFNSFIPDSPTTAPSNAGQVERVMVNT
ncbi:LOW QUALITY PROTEIN: olfactory receptor 6C74-like [Rhynochetos jubatus]